MEEQVRRLGGLLEKTNRKLQETSTSLREANTNKAMLEAEMNKLVSKMSQCCLGRWIGQWLFATYSRWLFGAPLC